MFVKGAGVIRKEPCTLLVNFIIFWSFYCSWRMQGLFPTPTPSVCEREFDLDGKTILSFFFFWENSNLKKTLIFKEHLYPRQRAVFQSTATCSSFCPPRKGLLA